MLNRQILGVATVLGALALASSANAAQPVASKPGFEKIKHIVVIYLENRSFDNLYGLFQGADGLDNWLKAPPQVDKDGKPFATLPPVMDTNKKPAVVDTRFPADLPNKPFAADGYAALDQFTGDLVHRYYQEQVKESVQSSSRNHSQNPQQQHD